MKIYGIILYRTCSYCEQLSALWEEQFTLLQVFVFQYFEFMYEGVSKSLRTDSITKCTLTRTNTH